MLCKEKYRGGAFRSRRTGEERKKTGEDQEKSVREEKGPVLRMAWKSREWDGGKMACTERKSPVPRLSATRSGAT